MRSRVPRQVAVGLLACLVGGGPTIAHGQTRHQPVILSFFHPISTNRSPDVSTNFRLNLLYTRAAALRGVDLGGLVARTDGPLHGLELTLAHSYVGGECRGIAATLGVAYVGGDARWLQAAGLTNFVRGHFTGLQLAGLFDYVDGGFGGIQLSSFYNLSNADGRGLQIASVMNATSGSLVGVQAGAINFASERMHGLQAGTCNFALDVEGVQVAVANFAEQVHGTQIGVWNQARRIDGVPFGMVNWVREDGRRGWVTYASNFAAINTGLRTEVHGFYSMVTVGADDLHDKRGDTAFIAWHYGRDFELNPTWSLGADLGFVHVIPQPSDDAGVNDRLHFAVQPRLLAERVTRRMRVFGGVGLSAIYSEYSSAATSDVEPLFLLGITVD